MFPSNKKYQRSRLIIAPLLTTALAALAACGSRSTVPSSDVESDQVFQQYNLWYDVSEKEVTTYAQFRIGGSDGTTLSLDETSGVTVNGKEMEEQDVTRTEPALWGTYYSRTFHFEERPPERFEFSYVDNDDETVTNSVTLPKRLPQIKAPTAETLAAARQSGLRLVVEQMSITDLRDAYCAITPDNSSIKLKIVSIELPSKTCAFTVADLAALTAGDYSIKIKATWVSHDVNHSDKRGGRKYITVITAPQEITIP
jgi:hypothetical protein